jgi:hypothetical protein
VKSFYLVAGEAIGIKLTTTELAMYDKVLKAHINNKNNENEGRTTFADEIEREDAELERKKLENMNKSKTTSNGCNCLIS